MIIFVDPGKSGGAVVHGPQGFQRFAWKSPEATALELEALPLMEAYIEQVHGSGSLMPNQVFEFGRNLGHWEGIFSAMGVSLNYVKPYAWQKPLGLANAKDYTERKKILYQRSVKVVGKSWTSRATCDAWLMAWSWCHYVKPKDPLEKQLMNDMKDSFNALREELVKHD